MNDSLTYEQVIDHFGTPSELARRLKIKPQAVYQWGGVIPPLRRYQIAELIALDAQKVRLDRQDHAA